MDDDCEAYGFCRHPCPGGDCPRRKAYRDFKETAKARAERDIAFREELASIRPGSASAEGHAPWLVS
jgi:hypothetical protein